MDFALWRIPEYIKRPETIKGKQAGTGPYQVNKFFIDSRLQERRLKLSDKTRQFASSILNYEHVASHVEGESRYEYASTHLRSGLDSGYLCAYATEEADQVASHKLRHFGIEERFLKEQQLRIFNINQIYSDDFDSQGIIEMYSRLYDTAKEQGFKGFLLVRSAFDFFTNRRHLLERFLSYESAFERANLPCKTTCLYPLEGLVPAVVLSTMRSHPHVLTPSSVMTSQQMLDHVFFNAFTKILGKSAAKATAFHLKQRAQYSPNLIEAGLEEMFGTSGARHLRRLFHDSLMSTARGE